MVPGSAGGSGIVIVTHQPSSPYDLWAVTIPGFTDTNPAHDPDGDGLTNMQEFAFGLNPVSGSSANPVTASSALQSAGQFSYTRWADSGLSYTVWTSPDLQTWTQDTGAVQTPSPTANGIQTVTVTLSTLPPGATLFVRVKAM